MGRNVACLIGICVLQLFKGTVGFPTIQGCRPELTSGYALYGFNDKVEKDISVETCFRLCMTETTFECKSFDYNPGKEICYMSATSRSTEPDHFGVHTSNNYYDIICGFGFGTTPEIETSGDTSGDYSYSGVDPFGSGDGTNVDDDLECSRKTELGKEYRGTVAKTVNGRTCQRWDSQYPHQHSRDTMFVNDDGIQESAYIHENYCRNPDGEPGGPWCYTTDSNVRWEYCDIRACEDDCDYGSMCYGRSECKDKKCYSDPNGRCAPAFCDGCKGIWYSGSNEIECELFKQPKYTTNCKTTTLGREYIGTANVTETGRSCQRWDTQYPHEHTRGAMFTDGASKHENYCRNPDNEPNGPWCYTTDALSRWEYCGIPECSAYEVTCIEEYSAMNQMTFHPDNFVAGRWMNIMIDLPITKWGQIESYEIYACNTGVVNIDIWRPRSGSLERVRTTRLNVFQKGYNLIELVSSEDAVYVRPDDVIGFHYPDDGGNDAVGGIICIQDSRYEEEATLETAVQTRFINAPSYDANINDHVDINPVPGIKRSFGLKATINCGQEQGSECPRGWDDNGNSCYKFVVDSDKYPDAAAEYCRSLEPNAHLVSIDDYDEFVFVTKNIKLALAEGSEYMAGRELWWTSGKKDAEGNWYWHNHKYDDANESPLDWAIWYPGEPNNDGGNEDYLNLLLLYGKWGLNDISMYNRLRFICELDKF